MGGWYVYPGGGIFYGSGGPPTQNSISGNISQKPIAGPFTTPEEAEEWYNNRNK